MRYQTITPDNRIVNHTAFGRRLRRFLRKADQRALLPRGATWRTDGAWMLADALEHWSRGRLKVVCLCRPDGRIEHVAAVDTEAHVFIDGDGIAAPVELMAKMALLRRAPNLVVRELVAADARAAGLPYLEDVALELAMRLLRRFARYRADLLALGGDSGLLTAIGYPDFSLGQARAAARRQVCPDAAAYA